MKQLTEYIFKQIIHSIKPDHDKQVIRVDGFDDLYLYLLLCQKVQKYCQSHSITLIAKLAKSKYEQLKATSSYAASQLESNHWIDFEDHMTSYRNIVPDDGEKLFVLMLGTDMVADKGGLNDFFSITPHTLDRAIGKKYSALMSDELIVALDDTRIGDVVDLFFGELFSLVPQNLSKLSEIMDNWLDTQPTVQDIIQELYCRLPDWQIPMVIADAEALTPAKMEKQKKKSLIRRAYDFYNGKSYARITQSTIKNVINKFTKYKEQNGKYYSDFPTDSAINSYDELQDTVIAFIAGNHNPSIRQKLLNTDYSVIDAILNLKGPGPVYHPDREIKVYGSPLTALCGALLDFMNRQEEAGDRVEFKFASAHIAGLPSGVYDKDELANLILEKWTRIASFAGGIIDFISEENWVTKDDLPLQLTSQPANFFSPCKAGEMYENSLIVRGTGGKHKIYFTLTLFNGDTKISHADYSWHIDPFEDWLMAFSDLFIMPEEQNSYLPFALIDEMNAAFSLKDEEGFAFWYDHHERHFLTGRDSIIAKMNQQLLSSSSGEQHEIAQFYNLGRKFSEFQRAVLTDGFYSTISNKTAELIDAYIQLADRITSSPIYTNQAQPLVQLFMNAFNVCSSTDPIYTTGNARQFITPPYHPAMLEKIADRMIFIRTGLKEWALRTHYDESPWKRIDSLVSLSAVHNATDAYFKSASELQPHSESFGYYVLYGSVVEQSGFVSALEIQRQETVFDDDFDDSEMKRLTRESEVLLRVLKEYTSTYPQSKETFTIVFINPSNLQHVVSSLYQYVIDLRKDLPEQIPSSIRLTVINRNELHGARTYLSFWINHVFTADDNLDMKVYLNVYKNENDIPKLIPSSTDLAFFFDALDTEQQAAYNFIPSIHLNKDDMRQCRFPLVFKPTVSIKGSAQHSIDITQPQFGAATAHTQVLRLYRDHQIYDFHSDLVQVSNLDLSRGEVIKKIQDKVVWLACIDSAMDKSTVRRLYADDTGIIGFTTGEGSYGQMNIALTCRKAIADDMMKRCANRIRQMFHKWSNKEIEQAAMFCMQKARDMDGVSILRAMNPSDYQINNFLAYLIADELTRNADKQLNILIRLDSYRHWFQDNKSGETKIPDFLLLQADIVPNQPLHFVATVIEAKIAGYNSMQTEHLPKAQIQIQDGLSVLKSHFNPDDTSVEHRYWMAQLYRAIVFLQSDLEIDDVTFKELTNQLNAMVEGKYEFEWHAQIMACEIDSNTSITTSTLYVNNTEIEYKEIGQLAMKNILLHQALDTYVEFDPDAKEEDAIPALSEDDTDEAADLIVEPDTVVSPDPELPQEIEDTPQISEGPIPITDTSTEQQIQPDIPASNDHSSEEKPSENEDVDDLSKIRVLIGKDHANREVYWEFGHPQLANRHLLITGGSGQGKTYAIQTFLFELSKQKISSVVFDYTDGFLPSKLEPPFAAALEGKIDHRVAILHKIPINPFKQQMIEIDGFNVNKPESSSQTASRFAAIMKHVYKFGEQQYSTLYSACKEGIDSYGNQMNFDHLKDLLSSNGTSYAKSVLNKIIPLVDQELFDTEHAFEWSDITKREGKVTVIQLHSLDRETQTVITEMLMWDAWYSLSKNGLKDHPFVVVLDEAQNLSFADGSPAQKILQEGRKYGWSAWFATQFLKGALSSDEISRLQQAAERLYFKPSNEEISSIAQMLSDESISSSEWMTRIKHMQKGNCIVHGDRMRSNNTFGSMQPTLVKVSSFEDRR